MHIITVYLVALFVLLLGAYAALYLWGRRHWYIAAKKFNGPTAYPIIGNAYIFMCKNEEILMRMHHTVKQYPKEAIRFWLGPLLLIVLPNPDHVEKILPSSKFSRKHDIYRFPKVFLGEGLITGSGPLNKKHRRIIQPMFDLNFAKESTSFMQDHIALCMKRLEPYVGKGNFDFFHVIHPCMADIIKEIVLGSDERSQINGTTDFDQAMLDGYEFAFTRMVKVWQHPDILFNLTPLKKRQDEIRSIIKSKGKEMTEDAFNRRKSLKQVQEFHPVIDRIVDYIQENPGVIDRDIFIDHILTLYTASEDTLSIVSYFVTMCLGMYPECQAKAVQEIKDIFGDTPRPVTTDDVPKMRYMDMCIKEALRLFPVAPIILRKCTEDFEMEKWVIPKGCAIVIPIFTLHRDPRSWEKPNEFYPEHFLPEVESKRHVYTYIPFSAGPRGCIGKILANTGIKIFMANLLQRFEIEADGDVPNLKIKMDISTRPTNGYNLRLKNRVWK